MDNLPIRERPSQGDVMSEDKKEFSLEELQKQRKEDKDEFDAAFDDAMQELPDDKEGLIVDTDTKDDETKDGETDEAGDDPLSKISPDGDDSKPKSTTEAKTVRELELEAELLAAQNKMSTWEGRISAANKRAQEAIDKAKALEAKVVEKKDLKEDLPTGDDDKAIKEFLEEFPDLHKPIIALVKRDLLPLIGQMIDNRIGEIQPEVTSIKETMEADSTAAHFAAIAKAHPGYKEIISSGKFDAWAITKPEYVQVALANVRAQGSTQEVIDMFNDYNRDAGIIPAEKKTDTTKDDKAKSKAEDLLAVPASPTKIDTQSKKKDKEDFDSAWDEAVKTK